MELRRAELKRALPEIVPQLKNMGAIKIILFGSFAAEEVSLYSDLDIFAIMPYTKTGKEWLKEVYQKLERYVAADIIVFNAREYEQAKDEGSFLKEIGRKGKVMYEKKHSLPILFTNLLKRLKKKI